jgi:hypothetical protein
LGKRRNVGNRSHNISFKNGLRVYPVGKMHRRTGESFHQKNHAEDLEHELGVELIGIRSTSLGIVVMRLCYREMRRNYAWLRLSGSSREFVLDEIALESIVMHHCRPTATEAVMSRKVECVSSNLCNLSLCRKFRLGAESVLVRPEMGQNASNLRLLKAKNGLSSISIWQVGTRTLGCFA